EQRKSEIMVRPAGSEGIRPRTARTAKTDLRVYSAAQQTSVAAPTARRSAELPMPELPEVETTRQGLAPLVVGQRVAAMHVYDRRLRWSVPSTLPKRLAGR